jgi:alkylation response protein AidB-like acyl-CoA dehydrogenase
MVEIAGTGFRIRVAYRCMRIHGAMARAIEIAISKISRDARSFIIAEGIG